MQLVYSWEKIDNKVKSLTSDDFEISQIFNWV